MSAAECPTPARLAAAASGEDERARDHASVCAACRAELDAMLDVIATARRAPVTAPTPEERAAMRAQVLAFADLADDLAALRPAHRSRRAVAAVALVAAVAAAVVVWMSWRRAPSPAREGGANGSLAVAPAPAPIAPIAPSVAVVPAPVAPIAPAPAPRAPVAPSPAPGARAAHDAHAPHDLTALADGTTTIDTRFAAPIHVAVGDTTLDVRDAKVEVTSHGGTVATVRVFAGSAEIVRDGRRVSVASGELWTRPAETSAETPTTASLRAFEDGWTALRAARYADAIASFDLARDPVVAEDAAYWAAIASERAGHRDDAIGRLRRFVTDFPSSPRAADARAALARLAP